MYAFRFPIVLESKTRRHYKLTNANILKIESFNRSMNVPGQNYRRVLQGFAFCFLVDDFVVAYPSPVIDSITIKF